MYDVHNGHRDLNETSSRHDLGAGGALTLHLGAGGALTLRGEPRFRKDKESVPHHRCRLQLEPAPRAGRGTRAGRGRRTGRGGRGISVVQRLHGLLQQARYAEFRAELARAELSRTLSELWVLSFHALLAILERSGFAPDYLEMAEVVAASPWEHAFLAEVWASHEMSQGDRVAAVGRCLDTLGQLQQRRAG
jgi:hypothetical protein